MGASVQPNLSVIEQALRQGEFARAEIEARRVLEKFPAHAETIRLLGAALHGSGRLIEARQVLTWLTAREPDNPLAQNSLGAALRSLGDLDGAESALRRACRLAPAMPPFWYNYAIVLFMLDRGEEGLAAIDRALALAPGDERMVLVRSHMLREQGRIAQVTAEYRNELARRPDSSWAWFALSNLKNVHLSDAELAGIRRALTLHTQANEDRAALLFALAKACDDHAQYTEAYAALVEGNRNVRQRVQWNAREFSADVDALLRIFSSLPAKATSEQGREVIFLVSPPRSGSTLVEQILASHRDIEGAGERDELQIVLDEETRRRGVSFPAWMADADADDWTRLGARYLELTAKLRANRPRFTDKTLSNWLYVGAIRMMLPAAKIVVCRRDAVETCFSCYRQLFGFDGQPYSYDIGELAAYWSDFDRACKQWQAQHPDHVHELVYEDLVRDQEAQTRALLAFCGLDFDPACLRFFETERKVSTISSAQVREPLHGDTAQAAKYGNLLDPLRAALGLPPFAGQAPP
jgi:tetratricopeptide (TPR) repeat protein